MSSGDRRPGEDIVALNRRRELTIEQLCAHFAEDHFDAPELERLIDRAHGAVTVTELDSLLAGLPALQPAAPPQPGITAPIPLPGGSQTLMAVMGSVQRAGVWAPGSKLRVFAMMGGAELDFRDATLTSHVTEIEIFVMMGGVEILVPPGVHVVSDAFGMMGGVEHRTDPTAGVPGPGAPILRITGFVFMGGVEISERLPGESAKDARRRRKNRGRLPRGTSDG